ncbi:MAG TPA: DoxX family protein [Chitinophagales bacterium]|nr:DoxX family protein [Chitinophagales bacterium]HRG27695.1 DoxX family protein [Chitinophagales bacterium]HRG84415.1 DoxX family protein [Chitinophagales bacterium]HRH53042.1 DoxX family protein [Chitinophagales bacterium]
MKKWLFNANATYFNIGMLFLRIALGASFIYNHGFKKIADPSRWGKLGAEMQVIHIDFAPAFWGFMAAFSEFFGAVFIILGLFTRLSAFMLAFTMFIAFMAGNSPNDFNAYPFEMMLVFITIMIIGPGKLSIDAQISGFKK